MADEKKISFDDERLNQVAEEASEAGKTRFEEQREVFERINGTGSGAEENPSAPTPRNPGVVIKNLRTFQGDVAEALKNQNSSVVSIALAEQRRSQKQEELESLPTKKRWGWGKAPEVARITGQVPRKPSPLQSVMPVIPKTAPETKAPQFAPASKPEEIPRPTPRPEVPPSSTPAPQEIISPRQVEENPLPRTATPKSASAPMTSSVPNPPRKFEDRIVFSAPKKQRFDPEFVKNATTIAVSILLILLGIGTVVGFYVLQKTEPRVAQMPPIDRALLPYTTKETLQTTQMGREAFLREVSTIRRNAQGGEHDILYIALPEGDSTIPLSTPRLFSILQTEAPGTVLRAFGDQFMLGMVRIGSNQPFLLIRLTSFENAFDGMLRWEKTLNRDLGALFSTRTIPITEYLPESGVASTTATTSTTAVTRVLNVDLETATSFEDITIRNKDARVLKNDRGDILLLYSFLDQNTLLITSGPAALNEIMDKIIAERLIR